MTNVIFWDVIPSRLTKTY